MTLLVDTTIRVSLIILIAFGGTLLLRRRSAAVRHWVLALGIVCGAATPLLQVLLPSWHIDPGAFSSAAPAGKPSAVTTTVVVQNPEAPRPHPARAVGEGMHPIRVSTVVMGVWLGGAAVSLSVLLVGSRRLSRVASTAHLIEAGPWAGLSAEICGAIGVRRPVELLQSDHPRLLVTWGLAQPKILLPASAAGWPNDRARVILQHELAHIRRGDWIVQMTAEVLRAVYWFNPLLWIACRRLRQEGERACDDEVLDSGVEPADYASHLVDLARSLNAMPRHRPALAMARSSSLEGRVSAMLNARLNRRPLTRATRVATAVALVALAVPIAIAAQNRFSTLAGTVLDQTNRFVPAATLTLRNVATDAKYEVHADQAGRFEFVGLPSGDYQLEAMQPGFATFSDAITIARDLHRVITLQIGSVHETVTTTADAAIVPDASPQQRQEVRERVDSARRRVAESCAAGSAAGERGGNVLAPLKVIDVRVVYPEQLKATGIGGVVTLDAQIGTDGSVRDLKVLTSSSPELESAAIDAVRRWEFTPTYLNCTPVEVRMQVTVNFVVKP